MASSYRLPQSISEWTTEASRYLGNDPLSFNIAGIGRKAGSASKVDLEDWLLLRAIWRESDQKPSLEAILNKDAGKTLAARTTTMLQAKVEWWKALETGSTDHWAWGRMGPWRHSANEILMRGANADAPFIQRGTIFDGTDPARVTVRRALPRDAHHQGGYRDVSDEFSDSRSRPVSRPASRQPSERSDSGRAASSSSGSSLRSAVDYGNVAEDLFAKRSQGSGSVHSAASAEVKFLAPSRPDEALINMSFILFLQGLQEQLGRHRKLSNFDWSILHKGLAVSPMNSQGVRTPILTAKTDGCLVARSQSYRKTEECAVLAIVEVKPFRRNACKTAIQMQESTEMAAWLSTEDYWGTLPAPDGKYRRLLLAQDLDEIYVIVAEYDDKYIRYIKGNPPAPDPRPSSRSTSSSNSLRSVSPNTAPSRGVVPRYDLDPQAGYGRPGTTALDARTSRGSDAGLPLRPRGRPQPSGGSPPQGLLSSTAPPMTPSRQQQQSLSPPGAPGPAPKDTSTDGFLVMNQYAPLNIGNPSDLKRAMILLTSLMDCVCENYQALHPSPPRK